MSEYFDDMNLSDLDPDFEKASDNPMGENPPDDRYKGRITNLGFAYTQSNERRFEIVYTVVSDGEYQGCPITRSYLLRPKLLSWLKADLKKLGFQFTRLTELLERQADLMDTEAELLLKTKADKEGKQRQDIMIVKVFSDADESTAKEPATTPQQRKPRGGAPF